MGEAIAVIAPVICVFVLWLLLSSVAVSEHLRAQAVERGYAIYCPNDGKWAWKGECDQ